MEKISKVVATLAAMVALCAVSGVAQAATGQVPPRQWRVVYRTHSATAGPLSSVTAPTRDDAWAVGTSGTGRTRTPLILHWNGVHWRPVTISGTAAFEPGLVTSASPGDVWILGTQGKQSLAWIRDGAKWQKTVLPGPFQGGAFAAVSRNDAWGSAFASCVTVSRAGQGSTSCASALSHWNGVRWSTRNLGGFLQDMVVAGGHVWFLDLTGVQGVTSNHPTGVPVLYEVTGSTVKKISTAAATRVAAGATLAVSPGGQVWVLGHLTTGKRPAVLQHLAARRWTRIAVPAQAGGKPLIVGRVLTYGGGGVWAGPFAHWTGQRWLNTSPGREFAGGDSYSLSAIARVGGTASMWAVGRVARTPADKTPDSLIARYGPAR